MGDSEEQSQFLSACSCVFILSDSGVTFHAILFAKCTPNTFTEVREDLAHLENGLGCQQAICWYWGKKRNRNGFGFFGQKTTSWYCFLGFKRKVP